jgi:hypothetical protein
MSNKVESEHGAEILKQTQAMADLIKGMVPKVSTNANGYEIMSDLVLYCCFLARHAHPTLRIARGATLYIDM